MKGYKVFLKEACWLSNGIVWKGPYFYDKEYPTIRAGAILEADNVNMSPEIECGQGVNFWTNKESALHEYMYWSDGLYQAKLTRLYEIETLDKVYGPPCKKGGRENKKRTCKLKLVRLIKNPLKEFGPHVAKRAGVGA